MAEPAVNVLRIEPGDALVIKVDALISDDTQKMIYAHFRGLLAEAGHLNVPMMVIDRTISMDVLRVVKE